MIYLLGEKITFVEIESFKYLDYTQFGMVLIYLGVLNQSSGISFPQNINIRSLGNFKTGICKWKPKKCSCRICKTFAPNIYFLQYN